MINVQSVMNNTHYTSLDTQVINSSIPENLFKQPGLKLSEYQQICCSYFLDNKCYRRVAPAEMFASRFSIL